MIEVLYNGSNSTTYKVTTAEAPGRYALVTDDTLFRIPQHPETDTMMIGLYLDHIEEFYDFYEPTGREGLIDLLEHEGTPDELRGADKMPIKDLIETSAARFLVMSVPHDEHFVCIVPRS